MTKSKLELLREYIEAIIDLDRLEHSVDTRVVEKYRAEERIEYIAEELNKVLRI